MALPTWYYAPECFTGIGYDVHQLVDGRKLVIGGVHIPYARGLKGHSDADVLLHAIMDAILGAAALGDIGEHFPDTRRKYKGASSLVLLKQVGVMAAKAGFTIVNNIDAVLIAEEPKITPYKKEMRARIAKALGTDASRVNIKATTNEGLGFIGAKQGMAAYATASLRKA